MTAEARICIALLFVVLGIGAAVSTAMSCCEAFDC